jgi:hypothetical protein
LLAIAPRRVGRERRRVKQGRRRDPAADIASTRGEIVLYATEDGQSRIECRFEQGALWLSQAAITELYQATKQNVSRHLKNIFAKASSMREQSSSLT